MREGKVIKMDDYKPTEKISSPLKKTHPSRDITDLRDRRLEMARGLNLGKVRDMQKILINVNLENNIYEIKERIKVKRKEVADLPTTYLISRVNASNERGWRMEEVYYKVILEALKNRGLIT